MPGTKAGGVKAVAKLLKSDPDYFRKIGKLGGKASGTGGFAYSKANGLDTHIKAGRKGGKKSRREFTPEQVKQATERMLAGRLQKVAKEQV